MTAAGNSAILAGQDFFRVKQRAALTSFAVESQQSVQGIYVGPDSSYAQYKVYYADPANQLTYELATITPGRPFLGNLQSLLASVPRNLAQQTIPGGVPIPANKARIIVIADDTFDRVALQDILANGPIEILDPVFDIVAITNSKVQVLQSRADVVVDTALNIPANAVDATKIWFLPTYDRKSFTIQTGGGGHAAPDFQMQVDGVKFSNKNKARTINLSGPLIDAGAGFFFHYENTVSGSFDYIAITTLSVGGFAGNNPEDFDDGGYRLNFQTSD